MLAHPEAKNYEDAAKSHSKRDLIYEMQTRTSQHPPKINKKKNSTQDGSPPSGSPWLPVCTPAMDPSARLDADMAGFRDLGHSLGGCGEPPGSQYALLPWIGWVGAQSLAHSVTFRYRSVL